MTLLFSLYTISGGIRIGGDIPAGPRTNTTVLAIGGLLASFVGTTGASMLLIRPLLRANENRRHVVHTVVFFIFIVSNIGGCLLPIGDPPLFIGYLRGVPFLWTLQLWSAWAFMMAALLTFYYVWDSAAWKREPAAKMTRPAAPAETLHLDGGLNFLWLFLVIACVGLFDPAKPFLGTNFTPPVLLREVLLFILVGVSWLTTPSGLRQANRFNFTAIAEVACLFIGIFLTMQIPMEILNARGEDLRLTHPWQFFWATGILSSFLDNAPTYLVFFQTANALTRDPAVGVLTLMGGDFIREDLLRAISLGAVFMGANTYIGNGPNFMVKAIAEQAGIRMPTFLGYMFYSIVILVPLFIVVALLFLR
jgi:Na+/H+ antiporter NhaD/arsenite permease-like protein